MKQVPQNVETALSHEIKLEAFEQSLACQGILVDHNDGRSTRRPHTACADTGPSQAGGTAKLRELIEDLQNTLKQATRRMAAMAAGLFSGCATPLDAASSASSIPGTVSTPPAPAPGHMASGQPGHGGTWTWGSQAFEGDRSVPPHL